MIELSKLHATGNDFLVHVATNDVAGPEASGHRVFDAALVRHLCDRRLGVGADGVIQIFPPAEGLGGSAPSDVDVRMELRNADGEVAEMSGNGIRCLAWVAHREGFGTSRRLVVETGAGKRVVDLELDDAGRVGFATCDMGSPVWELSRIPVDAPSGVDLEAAFHGALYRGDAVGMGNPHFVVFVDDVATAPVAQLGPRLEHDARFPRRTNVEFVAPVAGRPDTIAMRVWERGVGETLSCGTGACAAAAAANRRGLVGRSVTVQVPGGTLAVELGDTVHLGGPVEHVFDLELDDTGAFRH